MILYHNPNCSKSRAALAWLQEIGADVQVVDYLQTPLTASELGVLARQLGVQSVREMMRTDDELFHNLVLQNADEMTLIMALAAQPKLLQRPILVMGDKAAIGRPLSNIQALVV